MKINVYYVTITTEIANQRLDNFLRTHLKGVPKSMIYRIIRKGNIQVNKKKSIPSYKLQINDKLQIPLIRQSKQKKTLNYQKNLKKINYLNKAILYEDKYLLVINKPSGTAVHGGNGLFFNIIEGLRMLRPKTSFLELVHRLDKDTSGVLLMAKNRATLKLLHEQLRLNKIKKEYLALVRGHWQQRLKKVAAPLLKHLFHQGKSLIKINNKGKLSETIFKITEYFTYATLLTVRPITGRTHQIRVHAQYAGHPIAFDNRYGDIEFDKQLKKTGLKRLFLHASTICFFHPNYRKLLYIKAPMDDNLNNCLLYLRTYYSNESV